MTWVRLDDVFVDHPKVEALSDAAFRLHVRAMCYCARFRTDGCVPKAKAAVWARPKVVNECVAVGVWDAADDCYTVHDFLIYNPSKADLDKKAMAGAKGAAIRYGKADATADANQDAIASPSQPVPARPRPPPPAPPDALPADALTACTVAYDELMGSMASTVPIQREIADWLEVVVPVERGVAAFKDACHEAALNDGKSLKYVMAILKRWEKEGRADKRTKQNSMTPGLPGTPEHGCATQVGAGLVVKCMECDLADQRRMEAKRGA